MLTKYIIVSIILIISPCAKSQEYCEDCDSLWKLFQSSDSWSQNRKERKANYYFQNYKLCLKGKQRDEQLNKLEAFDKMQPFKDGYSIAECSEKLWLIDSNFNKIRQIDYKRAIYAGNRNIIVENSDSRYLITNLKGRPISKKTYSFLQTIRNEKKNTTCFVAHEAGSLFLLNEKLKVVYEVANYSQAHVYFNRLLFIKLKSEENIFLNSDFKRVHSDGKDVKFFDTKNHVIICNNTIDSSYIYKLNGDYITTIPGRYFKELSNDDFYWSRRKNSPYYYYAYDVKTNKFNEVENISSEKDRIISINGKYLIFNQNGKLGIKNNLGEQLLPYEYDECRFVINSWFSIKKDSVEYYYDAAQNQQIKKPLTENELKTLNKNFNHKINFGKYPFLNVKTTHFEGVFSGNYTYLDSNGQNNYSNFFFQYIQSQPDLYYELSNSVCYIYSYTKGMITSFPADYISSNALKNPYFLVYSYKGKMGLRTLDGNNVLAPKYDKIEFFDHDLQSFLVSNNNLKGVVLTNDISLIECKYFDIKKFEGDNYYIATKSINDKSFEKYSLSGKVVL